ncbi:class I SAM-dependent methyltransferase [Tabrizicola sp.]|uniref:class I SAM-dependent DNA methyltransferase n=1 Tax=Tabrizicola sp. TaxID=2005166 RepID=UPI00286A2B27|nr:class I SAM-dependent methyltransferase [Tabrizicola sp.]
MTDELPQTKAARVDWVIRAPDNAEMRRRYDIWANAYDSDVGAVEDYLAPMEVAKVVGQVLERSARILDAGAGTGLLGQALKDSGFHNIVAVDYSDQMLEIARGKAIYTELHICDLNNATAFAPASFDAVVTCGTTSQMPSASLREFARLLRPGGSIVFAVLPEAWESCGWAVIMKELEAAHRLTLGSRGVPFQMMPTTEPDFMCEIWVLKAT